LLGLQYKIIYKQGVENRAADALSRKPAHSSSCAALSVCSPLWLDEVAASYEGDSHAQSIIARLVVNSAVVPHFTWQSGLLRYKNRIWIGHHSPFTPGRDALLRLVVGIVVVRRGNEPKRCPPPEPRQAFSGWEPAAASSFTALAIVSTHLLPSS